jgi:hypothetical protein
MNNQPVGRIAGIIDDFFIKQSKKRTGFFGFYESINDEEVAHLLLSMVESWLISKNCTHMIGPIDGRVDNGAGFMLDSFRSQPTIFDSYSPSYYLNFARKYGMKKHRDLLTFSFDLTVPLSDELKTSALKSKQENHIHLRRFNRWKSQSELRWWVPFFLDSFSAHWGYIPVDNKEVKQRYGLRNIRWICDSDLFIIAENSNGPIGFLWGTPDYNQIFKKIDGTMDIISTIRNIRYIKRINYGKLNVIGINKEYQNRDLALLLNYEMLKRMQQRGYKGADIGWIDEHNSKALKVMEKMGAIHNKTFRVYEKEIHSLR